MKTVAAATLAFTFILLPSCGSLGGPTPDQVAAQVAEILADQVVTPDELEALKVTLRASTEAAQQTDWGALLATAGGTLLSTLLGVKLLPSRALLGPFDRTPAA